MQIKTWSNFSKRVNSTKQPTDASASIVTVALKDMCDILNPSFILNTTNFDINYVQAFGNYYFAQCYNLDGHRTEIKCSLDHLATFKSNIGSYNGLVEYTSSSSNVMITDPRNVPTMKIEHGMSLSDLSWSCDSDGTYILGVIGTGGGATGMTAFYSMNQVSFILFMNEAFSTGIIDDIINDFNGVQNCIVSCYWTPLSRTWINSNFSGNDEAIQIGRCQGMTAHGYKFYNRTHTESDAISIAYPINYTTKTYLHKSPFLTGNIWLPFCGSVPLDVDLLADDPDLDITMTLDILTGDIVYYISQDTGYILSSYSGNCASKIPVSGASLDGSGVVSGAVSMLMGGASAIGGNMSGVGQMMGGAMQMYKSASINSTINGAVSSAAAGMYGQATQVKIYTYMQVPSETNLLAYKTEQGMPYYKVATISTLSGYVKCANASVDLPGDGAEQDTVNNYMNSGFYYE